MTLLHLITRSLRYYRGTNLVAVFGLAIASAVIVGSLIIGDSIKGSLLDSATSRLGDIDIALTAPRMFRTGLATDLRRNADLKGKIKQIAPILVMRGSAESDSTDAVLPNVAIIGTDSAFAMLYPRQVMPTLSGRQAAINESLAHDLGIKLGDSILVSLDKQKAVPSSNLFSHRSPKDTMASLRLEVAYILSDIGAGGFRLDMGADTPQNIFVSSNWLTSAIGKTGQANTLLIKQADPAGTELIAELQSALVFTCALADYGLSVVRNDQQNTLSLQSDTLLLSDQLSQKAQVTALECGAKSALTSIYLASEIRNLSRNGTAIAYSVISGLQPLAPFEFASGGSSEPAGDGIWLNSWAAQDLKAAVGDRLELSYMVPSPDGTYRTDKLKLTLSGIVDITGPANDRTLVPTFEGITNTERIEDWNTPFPVDLHRVTARDDDYWAQYGPTPKTFVSVETAKAIWDKSASGIQDSWITSLRITPKSGRDLSSLKSRFEQRLLISLSPSMSGLVFRPLRHQAIQSAQGTTDFSQLFMMMSFFIVISGAGLAAGLLKISTERRASEIGTLLVCGFKPSAAMSVLLGEGSVLALAGALLGLPLGILYAYGVIAALKQWWMSAVGTSFLSTHITAQSLVIGLISGLLVGLISVAWSALRLRKLQVLQLISGWQYISVAHSKRPGRRSIMTFTVCITLAVILSSLSAVAGKSSGEGLFFGIGTLLLIGSLAFADIMLVKLFQRAMTAPSIRNLAIRSMAANRSRSLLVVGLLAASAFIIVTIAASTRDFSRMDTTKKDSGTGGFALRAISTSPVRYDLDTPTGRAQLGFSSDDEMAFQGVKVVSFLTSSGDDISCLNPTKAAAPRVLGVSRQMIERGGFGIKSSTAGLKPWKMLNATGTAAIPTFGDANTVMWNLHSGLGKSITIPGSDNRQRVLAFAGLMPQSIFASELLMSEKEFQSMFPEVDGPRYFLVDVPPGKERAVADILRRNLGRTGMDVRSTRDILNSFMGVQNTYLSMFLALGGLGVILGTVGLVVVILRSALERRREFALMLAQGFRRSDIVKLLLVENSWLLVSGLILGTVSALIAVIPALTGIESVVNWSAISVLFLGILITGLISCLLAAERAVRGILIDALRGEML